MGVFTYARAKEFRKPQAARQKDVSLSKLTEGVNATMKALLYDQISDVKGRNPHVARLCCDRRKSTLSLGHQRPML